MENKEERFMVVEMKNHVMPVFGYSNNKDWVSFGRLNNYPNYLIELYNRHATHGAIVKGKSDYVYGKGISYDKENTTILQAAKIQQWLEHANRYESWNEIFEKTARDYELFNGWAWQIIWNNGGRIAEVYRVEFAKLRRSKCGKKVYYCNEWLIDNNGVIQENSNPEKSKSFKCFDIFNPSVRTGTQILYFKKDEPSADKYGHLYPIPEYSGAVADIETDVEISNFHYSHLKNGLFSSSMITFFKGEPSEQEKKKHKRMFNYTYTSSLNTGKVMLYFANPGETPPDYKTLTGSDLDKMFEQLGKRNQENICSTHRADPVLFGIMTEGSLSDTNGDSVLKKFNKFLNTYIVYRQQTIINQIKFIAEVNAVDLEGIYVEQSPPMEIDLPTEPAILALFNKATLQKAAAKKYNIEIVEDESETLQASALPVNENIKSLTGRQYGRVQSLVSKYKNGKISYEEAAHLIKGFGLGDDYVTLVLGQKFSKQIDVVSLFEKFAIDDNDDEILREEFIHNETEALRFELKSHKFAEEDTKVQNQLIDLYKGDPALTPAKAAAMLGITTAVVIAALAALVAGGYMIENSGVFQPTEKAIERKIDEVKVETYTVYSYVTRPDVPAAETSRPFCKRMLALSNSGKRWTREGIESITNEFGEDAWVYRGGFYTNPIDGETTPYCRHIWKGIIKVRRKK